MVCCRCGNVAAILELDEHLQKNFTIFEAAPQVCHACTGSLYHLLAPGHFPVGFKKAFITPTVKKPGMDTTDVSSYRPISNLPVLSKLLERLVVRQLMDYLQSTTCCRPTTADLDQATLQKLLFCGCCRPWRCGCPDPSGSFSCIRHG